jgi:large subunit ribosomal protein L23
MFIKSSTIQKTITTEKTYKQLENGFYTFKVDLKASKNEIAKTILTLFGVKPLSVNTLRYKPYKKHSKNRAGVVSGEKRAIVKMPKDFKMESVS